MDRRSFINLKTPQIELLLPANEFFKGHVLISSAGQPNDNLETKEETKSKDNTEVKESLAQEDRKSPIGMLPIEMLAFIFTFLSIQGKQKVKFVSKLWNHASRLAFHDVTHLCIEDTMDKVVQPCTSASHSTGRPLGNSVHHLALRLAHQRKTFFKDIVKLKVFHLRTKSPRILISKSVLTTSVAQHLQCLEMSSLEFAISLPCLKHFKAGLVNPASFRSVIENSPRLTEMRVNLKTRGRIVADYFDLLLKLPHGLKHCQIESRSCDILAIISSPAVSTLETLIFRCDYVTVDIANIAVDDPRISLGKPSNLRVIKLHIFPGFTDNGDDTTPEFLQRFLKTCLTLEQLKLDTVVEIPEEVFSPLKKLKNVSIRCPQFRGNFDNVIKKICQVSKDSLETLEVINNSVTTETLLLVDAVTRIKTFAFCGDGVSIQVHVIILSK
jgi:hypothetical protein